MVKATEYQFAADLEIAPLHPARGDRHAKHIQG